MKNGGNDRSSQWCRHDGESKKNEKLSEGFLLFPWWSESCLLDGYAALLALISSAMRSVFDITANKYYVYNHPSYLQKCCILYIPTFFPFEIIYCDCMCFLRYSTLAYLFNQKICSQKLHCYFSSPIHSLKIGSRVKELNVTRTAEAIHRPWVNVFMGKWHIKSNCLSSDFRQSLSQRS